MATTQSGNVQLFSDFEDDGQMWAGTGKRSVRKTVVFAKPYSSAPQILLSISLMDAATDRFMRYEISAEDVTASQFTIVFKTWSDSQFARVWANWLAVGIFEDTSGMWIDI